MRVLAASLLAFSLTAPATPRQDPITGFMSVQRLAEHCDPTENSESGMADICTGYIAGAIDQIIAKQSQSPPSKRHVCLPDTLTIDDLRVILVAHLHDIPDEADMAASRVLERIASAQFPC